MGDGNYETVKILLVEDHADTAAMVMLLRGMGHEVRAAGACAQARDWAGQEAFGLLLCDIGLPDGDGCDLMREMRERHGLKGLALTAYVSAAHQARCRDAGFSRFLAKPFTLDELRAAVEAVL